LSEYAASVNTGAANLHTDIEYDAAHCPSSKIVLLGLSQGAQVIGNVLDKTTSPQLSSAAKARIYAVGLFGDPRFRSGESFNTGTMVAGQNGVWPRTSGNLSSFASRIRSLCLAHDAMCQANWGTTTGWDVHGTYGNLDHQNAMGKWALTKL
jgi:Cutinase